MQICLPYSHICSLQGLTKLLADYAPECMKEQKFENYFGRKIAVDASMHIYSFLVRLNFNITLGAIQLRNSADYLTQLRRVLVDLSGYFTKLTL